ncbi:hypothetical protein RB195_019688 [Necator americanus]|uniref:Uncharacterized protein n=1 Tax=Necator americanus TaxID=51031 RepID=A0ABR1CI65_NECAM
MLGNSEVVNGREHSSYCVTRHDRVARSMQPQPLMDNPQQRSASNTQPGAKSRTAATEAAQRTADADPAITRSLDLQAATRCDPIEHHDCLRLLGGVFAVRVISYLCDLSCLVRTREKTRVWSVFA